MGTQDEARPLVDFDWGGMSPLSRSSLEGTTPRMGSTFISGGIHHKAIVAAQLHLQAQEWSEAIPRKATLRKWLCFKLSATDCTKVAQAIPQGSLLAENPPRKPFEIPFLQVFGFIRCLEQRTCNAPCSSLVFRIWAVTRGSLSFSRNRFPTHLARDPTTGGHRKRECGSWLILWSPLVDLHGPCHPTKLGRTSLSPQGGQ